MQSLQNRGGDQAVLGVPGGLVLHSRPSGTATLIEPCVVEHFLVFAEDGLEGTQGDVHRPRGGQTQGAGGGTW